MPAAERPGDRLPDTVRWGGLLGPAGSPPPVEGGGFPGHARSPAHMQYVRVMSQPAKSSRTPATPDAPESAAGSRAAAQRLKMRRELAAAAMELFATKGYEATTVDEIAARAGVARRTFFRHFRSKEEAIFPDHDDTLIRAEAVLNAAPAHEHPLDTVCRGIKEVMTMYAAQPEISVSRYKLTREVPTLREAEIASVARYERLFTRYLLGHFDEHAHDDDANDDPLLAEVAASAVVTAHNHVLRRWLRAGGQGDVEAQLDHAFSIVRKTFGTGIGAGRETTPRTAPASAFTEGDVLVTVARVDAPLDQVMRTIEQALRERS
ncbi:TetR family transcriptional regulator [Streptomyces sp. S1A1-8]|nr:TetR family transcriptional regulator [Streptomyces sp. S1A1-7]QDN91403.1 TetR family transcriptional regulator [Streptomyces sp. RLB3-6]QDO01898.1 TetR family transcriptional regulator [Streptomyces sp. RLB1-9]QDO12228.1 TetR family transcriptional regulator [Streptomyces sp. S1D4-23]QDO23630.1 TetR family transcriptional regulator [Streptomyces sp. S1A1-8]QDO33756.1 TetR family transcriptional regulator [Streptomyces sp. S1A1-3]